MKNENIIIYGAGWTGEQVVTNLRDAVHKYNPVCFLDDDKEKHGKKIKGIKVYGGRDKLTKAITKFGATRMLIAMPSANSDTKREIYRVCLERGIKTTPIPDLP